MTSLRLSRLHIADVMGQAGDLGVGDRAQDGLAVLYRLSPHFPEPLLDHCLRVLVRLAMEGADA